MRKSEREVTRKAFRENKCPGQARERQAEKLDPGGDQHRAALLKKARTKRWKKKR